MVLLIKKSWDLKFHGYNQYLPGDIGWLYLQ